MSTRDGGILLEVGQEAYEEQEPAPCAGTYSPVV